MDGYTSVCILFASFNRYRSAVLDLSQLNFLSSLFLGMLVALHRQMDDDRGHLKICG